MGLDVHLKALYGIDQINEKLDDMKYTHVNMTEDKPDENVGSFTFPCVVIVFLFILDELVNLE